MICIEYGAHDIMGALDVFANIEPGSGIFAIISLGLPFANIFSNLFAPLHI